MWSLAAPIKEALERAVATGDLGYASGTAYTEALAGFASRRWGWDVSPGQMTTVADVITGYTDILCLLTEPGEQIVVNPPVYPPFYSYLKAAGRRIAEAPLTEDLRLDLGTLEEAFASATAGGHSAAYLLCNPHNPGGTAHTREEPGAGRRACRALRRPGGGRRDSCAAVLRGRDLCAVPVRGGRRAGILRHGGVQGMESCRHPRRDRHRRHQGPG
ncbi:hypothetical protein GCM10025876_17230 [Demequina litorisediminis]|uniref:cysteine-S-conjugate beta-lyase n=1 Tax=Demequina litorisediminis TaxID=1849022 RepID=A0ABQ6IFJ9_9MICO|nr:hypothetical protein GCM10025876_17230 [Demequina litorisediminis]